MENVYTETAEKVPGRVIEEEKQTMVEGRNLESRRPTSDDP